SQSVSSPALTRVSTCSPMLPPPRSAGPFERLLKRGAAEGTGFWAIAQASEVRTGVTERRDGADQHMTGRWGRDRAEATQSLVRSHRARRRTLEAALGKRAVHGRDHVDHARAPDPAGRGRRGGQALRA